MILSAQQLFSDAQNAAASGTVVSTNTIDLFPVGAVRNAPAGVSLIRDVGPGQPVAIVVCATSPAASTIKVDIIQSANANLSAPDILESSGVITLVAAKPQILGLNFLPDRITKQYIGLQYTTGAGVGGVNIDAGITLGKQSAGVGGT